MIQSSKHNVQVIHESDIHKYMKLSYDDFKIKLMDP